MLCFWLIHDQLTPNNPLKATGQSLPYDRQVEAHGAPTCHGKQFA